MVVEKGPLNYTIKFNFLDHYPTAMRIKNFPRAFK